MPHPGGPHSLYFPTWLRYVEALTPSAFVVVIAWQRDALVPPTWETLLIFAMAVPWVLTLFAPLPLFGGLPYWITTLFVCSAVLYLISEPVTPDLAPFMLVFMTFGLASTRSFVEGVVVMVSALAVLLIAQLQDWFTDAWPWAVGIFFMWGGGIMFGTLLRVVDELHEAQDGLRQQAATEERQRIAREIHDVVAHSLAVTMLHLTGARLALRRDIDDAERALLEAERLGRQSLAEIRATVGLLGAAAGTAPAMPSAIDIPHLVQEFDSAGLAVRLEIVGDPETVTPATGLALYRIAQESLANAVKHAPGTATSIRLDIDVDAVRMSINNPIGSPTAAAPGANGGLGIAGMKQRAGSLGGELRAGREGGDWCVVVTLPRELAPA